MLSFLVGIVIWVVVPGTLLGLIGYAIFICVNESGASAIAGTLAGFVICAIYAVSSVPGSVGSPNLGASSLTTLNVAALLVGLPVGVVAGLFLEGLQELPEGLTTLILTFSGSAGLYAYFSSATLHAYMLYAALALAAGFLIRRALSDG